MGGEKLISWQTVPPLLGSPPHGRGKGDNHRSYESLTRITPAWAGKRGGFPSAIALSKDHPRMGGEKFQRSYSARISGGSPPHGRGKELCDSCLRIRQRITPAWAGKRLKRSHRSGIFISGPIPFYSVLHRPAGSGGSRAGRDGSPAGQPQNAGPA